MASLKTLIVCLSSELPGESDRDVNAIYFVYNTLELYLGKVLFGENFCIVRRLPDSPSVDQIYIVLEDGGVYVYDDYGTHHIAQVQNEDMLHILEEAGESYYYNSKERYIDDTTRYFILPFNDGEFNMVVEFDEKTTIDENTIIRYNPETGHFEIGYTDKLPEGTNIVGGETDSAIVKVLDGKITADAKISRGLGNLIKVTEDGLYVTIKDKVTRQEYNSWKDSFESYRISLDAYIRVIENQIAAIEEIINEDTIKGIIDEELRQQFPLINEAIIRYNELSSRIDDAFTRSIAYADSEVWRARAEIDEIIREALEHPWYNLDPEPDPPELDPDEPIVDPVDPSDSNPEPDPDPTPLEELLNEDSGEETDDNTEQP